MDWLTGQVLAGRSDWHYASSGDGRKRTEPLTRVSDVYDMENRRPRDQWWMPLREVLGTLSWQPSANRSEESDGQ